MNYLSSPYSHPDAAVRELRFFRAMQGLAFLLREKLWTYSPIVHLHQMVQIEKLPIDAEYWKEYNYEILCNCQDLYELRIDGWEFSIGMKDENAMARNWGLPIHAILFHEEQRTFSINRNVA